MSISSGAVKGRPRGGATIRICGLSASLSGVEWQVGAELLSRKSRVLKSFDSLGCTAFHAVASLSLTRSKVSAANDGVVTLAARISRAAHALIGFIVYLSLGSEKYVHGAGTAVHGARRNESHDVGEPAQPKVHGGFENRAARA